MKIHLPTISLIASLALSGAVGLAQDAIHQPRPVTPPPAVAPRAAAIPVDEQVEAASEAALVAQDEALAAQDEALAQMDQKLRVLSAHAGRAHASTRSLVIPKDAGDAKNLADTEEDMSVMARILEKAASSKSQKSGHSMGINVWGTSGSSLPKNLYLDGFGALFFLSVNYPLLPPASKEQPAESKSETDTEWEKTRNEIYRPQSSSSDFSFNFNTFEPGAFAYSSSGAAEEYNEDKVSELKENLTAALKNAAHIRRLSGDDTVTVVVTGRNPGPTAKTTVKRSQNGSSTATASSSVSTSRSGSQAPPARLVIRARRTDIEAFQKDKISVDDFRKKVRMFTY